MARGRSVIDGWPKYEFRPDADSPDGHWYVVRPRVAYAWLERDYPRTATRFWFD